MLITKHFNFIHIPKTGGHWVKHITKQFWPVLHELEPHEPIPYGPEFSVFTPRFAVIRDPVEWMESWYHFHKSHDNRNTDLTHDHICHDIEYTSFDNFVWQYYRAVELKSTQRWKVAEIMNDLDIGPLTLHFWRLCANNFPDIVKGAAPDIGVHVGKLPTIREDFKTFLGNIDKLTKKIETAIDKTPKQHAGEYEKEQLDIETRALIEHKERFICARL